MSKAIDALIVGAGAAGCFAAIRLAELRPDLQIRLVEFGKEPLSKVRISGGGRCNVTHHQFDVKELVGNYPRGSKELRSVFSRFQPQDTVAWFKERGIRLKVEADGRMFPVTDSSATIIECFLTELAQKGIEIELHQATKGIQFESGRFVVELKDGESIGAKRVLLATGSHPSGHRLAKSLGHTIAPLAPSLFTFHAEEAQKIADLAGISVNPVRTRLLLNIDGKKKKFEQEGPLLITHWGFSGPAVLKLSAFAARELQALRYKFTLQISWLPSLSLQEIQRRLVQEKEQNSASKLANCTVFRESIPKRLWHFLLERANIDLGKKAGDVSNKSLNLLADILYGDRYQIVKKSLFKEEFVTCGGIDRKEVDFQRMESKIQSNLFFAGEILDIDGITGGFNFQNAWSGAWIAAQAMANSK